MDILKTLTTINACHGPSGDESGVADAIEALARPYADDIRRDVMGNLIVHKKGNGPRIMFAAHMDSIGFIVSFVEEDGKLRFGRLGGLDPYACIYTPVRFKNGVKGVIAADDEADEKKLTLNDLYIDIGAKSREDAEKQVKLGDTAVYDAPALLLGERISSPYLDNRICCVALLMALEEMKGTKNDVYFVFTVQEELGLRGAGPATYGIDPQYGIAVDITVGDEKKVGNCKLGDGAAIKVMDRSVICHPQMVKKLEVLAKEKHIPATLDVLRAGGTDAGAIYSSRSGVCTGGVSVPCRYTHSPVEMVEKKDVEATADLIQAFAEADLD